MLYIPSCLILAWLVYPASTSNLGLTRIPTQLDNGIQLTALYHENQLQGACLYLIQGQIRWQQWGDLIHYAIFKVIYLLNTVTVLLQEHLSIADLFTIVWGKPVKPLKGYPTLIQIDIPLSALRGELEREWLTLTIALRLSTAERTFGNGLPGGGAGRSTVRRQLPEVRETFYGASAGQGEPLKALDEGKAITGPIDGHALLYKATSALCQMQSKSLPAYTHSLFLSVFFSHFLSLSVL